MKRETFYGMAESGLVAVLQLYQHTLSILLGPCCRFTPSCSCYAISAIRRFGVIKGTCLALKRLVKCHPFHPGGYDPVPEISKNS